MVVREILTSAGVVLLVGLLLFAVSGVWPPMVAVESGSMQPHMYRGDLIFIVNQHRYTTNAAYGDTGVVTYRAGQTTDYRQLGEYGDVIIYHAYGKVGTEPPIIHRARFWVNRGENWYGKANKNYVEGAQNCAQLPNCPAPHAGFITKGDHNPYYDQVAGISSPVKPSWVVGTAKLRIPWLGWVRLYITGDAALGPAVFSPSAPQSATNALTTPSAFDASVPPSVGPAGSTAFPAPPPSRQTSLPAPSTSSVPAVSTKAPTITAIAAAQTSAPTTPSTPIPSAPTPASAATLPASA